MQKIVAFICSLVFSAQLSAIENITEIDKSFNFGKHKTFTINSKILERQYNLYIKVPSDYYDKKNQNEKYPVLFLNDAPHTFKVAVGVTHFKSMDKAIIVGVSFALGENGQYSRVRDLTPEHDKTWTKYTTGQAPQYLTFIENEVIAFVDENYRTNPQQRILSGHSLGGSFGAWVLLTKLHLFSSYILTSPSFWFKDDLIFKLEQQYASKNEELHAKVFFATGGLETVENGMRNDMVDGHRRFVKQLRSRNYQGLEVKDEVVSGTDHVTTFPVGLVKGLKWIYQDFN